MWLDTTEHGIKSIYSKLGYSRSMQHKICGFAVSMDIVDSCRISYQGRCLTFPEVCMYTYEQVFVSTSAIEGTRLVTWNQAGKYLMMSDARNNTEPSMFSIIAPGGTDIRVLYDGRYLLVTDVYYQASNGNREYCYIEAILYLYQLLTGTRMAMFDHAEEAKDNIKALEQNSITPIPASFMELLEVITDSVNKDLDVIINPKYDGSPCWLYISDNQVSLVNQRRSIKGNKFTYIGRVAEKRVNMASKYYAVLCERIVSNDGIVYIAVDCFTDVETSYFHRKNNAIAALYDTKLIGNMAINVILGDSYLYRICKINYGVATSITSMLNLSITDVMSSRCAMPTDGLVIYIGNNRPIKVKLCSNITVDLDYIYDSNTNKGSWLTTNAYMVSMLKQPHNLGLDENKKYVIEVLVSTGVATRIRLDRLNGNPDSVVNNVVAKYAKDAKYSIPSVWQGQDLKLTILLNRMFKRHCYLKYVPHGCKLIDMGSGNGGDLSMWLLSSCSILAIEKDVMRFKTLQTRVKMHTKIQPINLDMKNVMLELKSKTLRYEYMTFMRSIGHMTDQSIANVLRALARYGIRRIVIVTMVTDRLQNYAVQDKQGQTFKIDVTNTGKASKVNIAYNIGGKDGGYEDTCYSTDQWTHLAKQCGYSISIESQLDFMNHIFRLSGDLYYPCFTDVCIILDNAKYA